MNNQTTQHTIFPADYIREISILTNCRSVPVFNAALLYLTTNTKQLDCASEYGVSSSLISRMAKILTETHESVVRLAELSRPSTTKGKKVILNEEYLRELITLTSLKSEDIIAATVMFMTTTKTQVECANQFGVKTPNISRESKKLYLLHNKVVSILTSFKPIIKPELNNDEEAHEALQDTA
ncbi:hypothetical protein AB4254_08060 [Vibrio breoganii]